jgi:hypothetical protein
MHDSGNILKNWFFETNSAKKMHGFSAQQDTRFQVLSFPDTSATCFLVFLF